MIYVLVFLIFLVGFQFLVIIALYADRMIFMYEKGDVDMNLLKMDSKIYDVLKWVAMLFLPALAVLVKTVFAVWQIPYGDQIATTIMALNVFLSAILGISHIQYVNENEG